MFGIMIFGHTLFGTLDRRAELTGQRWIDKCPNNAVWQAGAEQVTTWDNQATQQTNWIDADISTITNKRCN